MRYVTTQYTIDGWAIDRREYKTLAGATKRAEFLRRCFPLARIEVTELPTAA